MHQTPLIDYHRQQNARLVDFAGWEMPITYTGIKEEHSYTRNHASLFDVSHMGRLDVTGPQAAAFLDRVCTRNIGVSEVGQSRYSHVCKEDGGILDDIIVSKLDDDRFLVVCNASNREKIVAWFTAHMSDFDCEMVDTTFDTVMVAIQGPQAFELVKAALPMDLTGLKRYRFKAGGFMGVEYFIARSGYTGEDGVEVVIPAAMTQMAVKALVDKSGGIKPAGLGARDTLRLEAGMPLYGHELTEDWDPITAGQKWCCDLSKEFIGVEKLREVAEKQTRAIVGLEVEGPRVARDGAKVLSGGSEVGFVTSGTHSPTFDKPLAMALISAEHAGEGTSLEVDIRGKVVNAKVVKLPFYKRG